MCLDTSIAHIRRKLAAGKHCYACSIKACSNIGQACSNIGQACSNIGPSCSNIGQACSNIGPACSAAYKEYLQSAAAKVRGAYATHIIYAKHTRTHTQHARKNTRTVRVRYPVQLCTIVGAIFSTNQTTKSACTNATHQTHVCAQYIMQDTRHRPCVWPAQPRSIARTRVRACSIFCLFASVCAKRQMVKKSQN